MLKMELIPLVREESSSAVDSSATRNDIYDDDENDGNEHMRSLSVYSDHHYDGLPDNNNCTIFKMKMRGKYDLLTSSSSSRSSPLSTYQGGEGRKTLVVTISSIMIVIGLLSFVIELAILKIPQPSSSSYLNINETLTTSTVPLPTIAFCGNSMTYYNDCPRLVELMLLWDDVLNRTTHTPAQISIRLQDSCLHGGANLQSLWVDGNGMESRFGRSSTDIGAPTVLSLIQNPPSPSYNRNWNYIVLQDDEQYVTGALDRNQSMESLREWYLPQILRQQLPEETSTTILLLQTFPYRSARLRENLHLGGYEEFTNAIVDGYNMYKQLIEDEFGLPCQIIPMATAVLRLFHEANPQLWDQLYRPDDNVHPSPYATWLQSCLIYILIMDGQPPPKYDETFQQHWQQRARHWAATRLSTVVENDFTTDEKQVVKQAEEEELSGGSIFNNTIRTTSDNDFSLLLTPPTLKHAEQLRQLACQIVLSTEGC